MSANVRNSKTGLGPLALSGKGIRRGISSTWQPLLLDSQNILHSRQQFERDGSAAYLLSPILKPGDLLVSCSQVSKSLHYSVEGSELPESADASLHVGRKQALREPLTAQHDEAVPSPAKDVLDDALSQLNRVTDST